MKVATRRLLEKQISVVVVLESGKKDDAMWHVPHPIRQVSRTTRGYGAAVCCTELEGQKTPETDKISV